MLWRLAIICSSELDDMWLLLRKRKRKMKKKKRKKQEKRKKKQEIKKKKKITCINHTSCDGFLHFFLKVEEKLSPLTCCVAFCEIHQVRRLSRMVQGGWKALWDTLPQQIHLKCQMNQVQAFPLSHFFLLSAQEDGEEESRRKICLKSCLPKLSGIKR